VYNSYRRELLIVGAIAALIAGLTYWKKRAADRAAPTWPRQSGI
jgi:hypothetical protein